MKNIIMPTTKKIMLRANVRSRTKASSEIARFYLIDDYEYISLEMMTSLDKNDNFSAKKEIGKENFSKRQSVSLSSYVHHTSHQKECNRSAPMFQSIALQLTLSTKLAILTGQASEYE